MKTLIEDTVETIVNYAEMCESSKRRKEIIKWATERIMDIVKVEISPIVAKLKEMINEKLL